MVRALPAAPAAAFLLSLTGCAALGAGPDRAVVHAETGRRVSVERQADVLAGADVVFLGELHDSPDAHELQIVMTALLATRRRVVLSLEMFERDVQPAVDAYLAGAIGEAEFLERSRPWSNYADGYRLAVEMARGHGIPVVAANLPRPVAKTIAADGLGAAAREDTMPAVTLDTPEYRARFEAVMGGHGGHGEDAARLGRWYAAQCAKDDAMAESILAALDAAGTPRPLVVHWCGRFHSDRGLGTVERLRSRRPDLAVAVVTTVRTDDVRRDPTAEELEAGDWVWLVRR